MPPTNDEEETDLRADLESAFAEDEETEDEGEETTDESAEQIEESTETTEEDDTEDTEEPSGAEEAAPGVVGDGEGEPTPSGINAPIGFSPEAREVWDNTPPEVQAEVQKREKEITDAVANTGEYRRTHQAIESLASQYAPILAAEGADTPIEAVEGLFKTVAELRVGSPSQKAQRMAGIIKHYGIDISMLDSALSGEMPDPETDKLRSMLNEELGPLRQFVTDQQSTASASQAEAQNTVNAELEEFAKGAEFLNDVREDMADLIDLASKRDRIMSFQEAYDRACAVHPTISKILTERASAEALINKGKNAANKRTASSSVRSGTGNEAAPKAGDRSLRDELEFQMDAQNE